MKATLAHLKLYQSNAITLFLIESNTGVFSQSESCIPESSGYNGLSPFNSSFKFCTTLDSPNIVVPFGFISKDAISLSFFTNGYNLLELDLLVL